MQIPWHFSLLCGVGHIPSQTKKRHDKRLNKKARIQTPVGAPDPFHMPTGLADGLGVESLPRCAPQWSHRFAPALRLTLVRSEQACPERALRVEGRRGATGSAIGFPAPPERLGQLRRSSDL